MNVEPNQREAPELPPDVDVLALDEALSRLEALEPRWSRLVELRFFAGFTVEETASVLEVSPATVKRDWSFARGWLYRELQQLPAIGACSRAAPSAAFDRRCSRRRRRSFGDAMLAGNRWTRVRALLEDLVDRSADDRRRYLAEACSDEPDVREEVDSLLQAREAAGRFLESAEVPGERGVGPDRAPALEPGTRLGPFEIVRTLGAGGMGEVYRARDVRLKRDVAIKVLPRISRWMPSYRARFEREARAISGCHIRTSASHDIGPRHDSTGTWSGSLAMELLDGDTLGRLLCVGALPLKQAARLSASRSRTAWPPRTHAGIVHRDLKPANVMIGKRRRSRRCSTSAWPSSWTPEARSRGADPPRPSVPERPRDDWARSATCRRSRRPGRRWTSGPTILVRLDRSTRWRPAIAPLRRHARGDADGDHREERGSRSRS